MCPLARVGVQLANAITNFALPIPMEHLEAIFSRFDINGDGTLEFKEFANYLKNFDLKMANVEETMRARKLGM